MANDSFSVMGVDPGGDITGFGIIRRDGSRFSLVSCGATRAARGENLPERLNRIYTFIAARIEEHRPDAVVVEDAFFGRNAQTFKSIGQVRGVAILAAARAGVAVFEYSPREIKKAVVGRGDASKEQVQLMITRLLGLKDPPKPQDAADALAAAICHSHRAGGVMF